MGHMQVGLGLQVDIYAHSKRDDHGYNTMYQELICSSSEEAILGNREVYMLATSIDDQDVCTYVYMYTRKWSMWHM